MDLKIVEQSKLDLIAPFENYNDWLVKESKFWIVIPASRLVILN